MKIIAPIQSIYFSGKTDTPELTVRPSVVAPYGVASWKLTASNASGAIANLSGSGLPAKEIKIPLAGKDLRAIGAGGDITVKFEQQDKKGQQLAVSSDPVKVNYTQISQLVASKEGSLTQEKYALILFDFDKATIAGLNQEIINRIAGRVKALPQAKVEIVGHTDNIGCETYNVKLSQRRAAEANKLLTAAAGGDFAKRASSSGVGPKNPLFDNKTPEARSFNRTVNITLEYSSNE
jgi:outer membrane protein OmpA-like peptidoglycan-associated protein